MPGRSREAAVLGSRGAQVYAGTVEHTGARVMKVRIGFEIDVADVDAAALAAALACGKADLEARLQGHARAALVEHFELYLGRRVFARGSDILEHRLALLIEHAFGNTIPSEACVSRLFQTTLPKSRSLLQSTLSKYRYQLTAATVVSARNALEKAKWSKDRYAIEIDAANLVDVLRQALAPHAGFPPLVADKDKVSTYILQPSAYNALCEAFGARKVAPK